MGLISLLWPAVTAQAHPYASGITNNSGTIQFILNESGGNVTVVYEDGSTNAFFNGVTTGLNMTKGTTNFALNGHTSFTIYVSKAGNGAPTLNSSDTDQFAVWNLPRGVDVNKNAKIGYLFGRTYIGNSAAGGTAPYNKGLGLYALNADLTDSPIGYGTNALTTSTWINSSGSGPWRLRVGADNTLYVGDHSANSAALWQFAPDLNSSNLVLAIVGRAAATNAGVHGDFFGAPVSTGSIATGDLVVWTADSAMAVPATTTSLGPNTQSGNYNVLCRYDIGAGPLPWNHSPNYAYSLGISFLSGLTCDMDVSPDGKIIGMFGRANLSGANVQVLNSTGATLLYSSLHDGADVFNGSKAAGSSGSYAGVRVSPDGRFIATVDANDGITFASLTNGIPDESTVFSIVNPPSAPSARGMCWDAADNILVSSSGQGLLRAYSLGLRGTAATSNDQTGTNGSFAFSYQGIIGDQIADRLVFPGTNVTFSKTVSLGTAPVTNQWFKGAAGPVTLLQTAITNATAITNVLTLANVTTNDAINYWNVYSDGIGSVTSLPIALEVVTPLTNMTANLGAPATITLQSAGPSAPTGYQWRHAGTNIANTVGHFGGVTNAALFITNCLAADAGSYSVVITSSGGTLTSTAVLTLFGPPVSSLSPTAAGQYKLQFTGSNGTTNYTVITSTNIGLALTNWTVLGAATNVSTNLYQYTYTNATKVRVRFYKLKAQ